ncbi:MAG TPA: hypothetical protein VLT86_06010 [Vicinamibacterales bacterium]|nr:hypothetical protein [Vicinamibacterales bacterium]
MTRRRFLALTAFGPIAACFVRVPALAQGLDRFTSGTASCKDEKPTPAVPDDNTFRPGAPERTVLAGRDTPGQRLTISGTVSGVVCGPIKGARVDFWQAGGSGRYDASGFQLRGYQLTDADGRYHVETIVPAATAGRARHINARVQAAGKPSLTTAIYFPDDAGNTRDVNFRPELVMTMASAGGDLAGTFNFVLNA